MPSLAVLLIKAPEQKPDPPESNIPADLLLCSFNSSQSSPMEQSTSKLQSPELFNAFACL